ncbi:MAG: MerR family transcriptional regulator [Gammaproteobacteria bacterium]|nr:MerR family transcriptional regulator [Gammaproteobacteria bacterium]PCH64437.1 MAG: MerR family transcriptional regulator [Gammaproteobacteria bacterium]
MAQTSPSKELPLNELPAVPNKRYFSIGEVGELCDLKPHVLRYWEQEFPQLSPIKRRGNRRYYQREDILLIRRIRTMLYDEGYTISGAKLQLKDNGHTKEVKKEISESKQSIREIRKELEDILSELKD